MIGIFDSGVGGLTVAKAIKEKHPEQGIIYFGDTARVPWGDKSAETVKCYAEEICNFFVSKKIKKIIIACNTASSLAGDYLKIKFPSIEIVDVVSPTINEIKKEQNLKRIAIIGTKAVIASKFYDKKLRESFDNIEVREKACPLFVPIVEEGWHNESFTEEVIRKYLAEIHAWNPDVLVLGCTHYPLLKSKIENILGKKLKVIDSASPVANYLEKDISGDNGSGDDQFFFSDLSPHYKELIRRIWGKDIDYKQINLTDCRL